MLSKIECPNMSYLSFQSIVNYYATNNLKCII